MLRRVMLRVLVVLAALTWACGDFVLYDAFLEPLSLSPSSAYLMVAESRSFEASGGTPGYRYRLRSGGGSIDPATGLRTPKNSNGDYYVLDPSTGKLSYFNKDGKPITIILGLG